MRKEEDQKVCLYLSTHSFEPEIVSVDDDTGILEQIGKIIGCEVCQTVRTERLGGKYILVVDEEGLLKDEPVFNEMASYLYEVEKHGEIIAGDAVIVKLSFFPGEGYDLEWLDMEEARALSGTIRIGLAAFAIRLRQKAGGQL